MSFNSSRWKTTESSNPIIDTPLAPSGGYARSTSVLPTKPKAAQQRYVEYAGFWLRFYASVIDYLIIFCVTGAPLMLFDSLREWVMSDWMNVFIVAGWNIVCPWLYHACMESGAGGTIGKQALGLKVTDMDGTTPTFWRATARHFGKIASRLTLGFGYVMAGFTEKRQAMHDMIAGCLVVKDVR